MKTSKKVNHGVDIFLFPRRILTFDFWDFCAALSYSVREGQNKMEIAAFPDSCKSFRERWSFYAEDEPINVRIEDEPFEEIRQEIYRLAGVSPDIFEYSWGRLFNLLKKSFESQIEEYHGHQKQA